MGNGLVALQCRNLQGINKILYIRTALNILKFNKTSLLILLPFFFISLTEHHWRIIYSKDAFKDLSTLTEILIIYCYKSMNCIIFTEKVKKGYTQDSGRNENR